MGLLLLYPAIVALSLFMLLAIIIVLRFGAGRCQLRHSSFSDRENWDDEEKESYYA